MQPPIEKIDWDSRQSVEDYSIYPDLITIKDKFNEVIDRVNEIYDNLRNV